MSWYVCLNLTVTRFLWGTIIQCGAVSRDAILGMLWRMWDSKMLMTSIWFLLLSHPLLLVSECHQWGHCQWRWGPGLYSWWISRSFTLRGFVSLQFFSVDRTFSLSNSLVTVKTFWNPLARCADNFWALFPLEQLVLNMYRLIIQSTELNYIHAFPLKPQPHDPSELMFNEMPLASCQGCRHRNHIILL